MGAVGILLVLLPNLFGTPYSSNLDWWVFFLSVLVIIAPAIWEVSRPPRLPVVFNRRTREIYYDQKGELYYSEWDDIEAVAYEYTIVNQYSGAIIHGNLEIVLRKFGDPDDRIVLNLSGVPAGKRLPTLLSFWESRDNSLSTRKDSENSAALYNLANLLKDINRQDAVVILERDMR